MPVKKLGITSLGFYGKLSEQGLLYLVPVPQYVRT